MSTRASADAYTSCSPRHTSIAVLELGASVRAVHVTNHKATEAEVSRTIIDRVLCACAYLACLARPMSDTPSCISSDSSGTIYLYPCRPSLILSNTRRVRGRHSSHIAVTVPILIHSLARSLLHASLSLFLSIMWKKPKEIDGVSASSVCDPHISLQGGDDARLIDSTIRSST